MSTKEITTKESNDVAKVTKQLCIDYIKAQNTQLTDGEFAQYAAVATSLNLNPFLREIYPIKIGGKMTLVTGYQVYIRRAEEFPQYDGFDTNFEGEGKNLCCICSVYRKDRSRPTVARVYLSEYTQGNSMWNSKPHVMLEKVAIGTAFRRAFPSEFNGMPYTTEEVKGEEVLQQQGLTEVKAEVVAEEVKGMPKADFVKSLMALHEENAAAFEHLKQTMASKGWKNRNEVPADKYEEVLSWWHECVQVAQIENIGNDKEA